MALFKVLIADDEEIIRRGIASFLKADPDISLIGQAEDGEMALEMAVRTLPDILFVDINMPFMNGLEFIRRVRDITQNMEIIIVSGYDDFHYAQEALRMGVGDYLLKPIMEKPFYAALDRAKARLSQTRVQSKYLGWAGAQLERNKPTLIAEFLEQWLNSHLSETEVSDGLRYLCLEMPRRVGVTVMRFFQKDSGADPAGQWSDDLIYYASENVGRELFEAFAPLCTYRNRGDDLVIISSCEPMEGWAARAGGLRKALESFLPADVSVAQGSGDDYRQLPAVYERVLSDIVRQKEYSPILQQTMSYIEASFMDPQLSLSDLAAKAHVSVQHLSRLFRQETGATFMDHLTAIRIRNAVRMLTLEDMKIYEIATRCGYSSQHYFSSAFKKILGASPMEYRKSMQASR
jgi:two-component system response regulator YesN